MQTLAFSDSVLQWPFAAVGIGIALLMAAATGSVLSIRSPRGRNVAVDGLRGYLAFGVLLHHATVWYFYVRGSSWGLPPESIYRGMGAACVSLFFMITANLFVGKLLDHKKRPVDWTALFISRIVRLTPLYLLAMTALFVIVGGLSGWHLREAPGTLLGHAAQWLLFSIFGGPDLNSVPATSVLIAVVTWTLAYEWLFYLSLPAMAFLLGVQVSAALVVAFTVIMIAVVSYKQDVIFPSSFLVGAFAAFLARRPNVAAVLKRPSLGIFILVALWIVLFIRPPSPAVLLLLGGAFCLIACGNTAFGLLSNRAAVVLGDVSYGIYLLHGLALSTTFVLLLGTERTAALSPLGYWLVVWGVGAAVVLISSITYRFLESPSMSRVPFIAARMRLKSRDLLSAATTWRRRFEAD